MKIYEEKLLEITIHGKLRTVSVTELFHLIADGYSPALTQQSCDDLKRLMWLTTQIFVQGDWLLESPWAVTTPKVKNPINVDTCVSFPKKK